METRRMRHHVAKSKPGTAPSLDNRGASGLTAADHDYTHSAYWIMDCIHRQEVADV